MRPDKFTQKMQEALQAAQDVAGEFSQQEINNEHFLVALLDQADGIARPVLAKMGASREALRTRLREESDENPRREIAELSRPGRRLDPRSATRWSRSAIARPLLR